MGAYNLRRLGAMAAGLAAIATETWINLTYVHEADGLYLSPVGIAVIVGGGLQAVSMSVMVAAWREGRYLVSLATAFGLAAAVAFTFSQTYERTAAAREARQSAIVKHNEPRLQAQAALDVALQAAASECLSGRGPRCKDAEARVDGKRHHLEATPPLKRMSHLGELDVVPKLALPLMLLILGFALVAYGETAAKAIDIVARLEAFEASEPPPGKSAPQPVAAEISERRRLVEQFERAYEAKHGERPRHRDVMHATGLPRATVTRYRQLRRATS